MKNCNFPQNVVAVLGLEFEGGVIPYDFALTLDYVLHKFFNERENKEDKAAMFWRYYTTEATYVEIAKDYNIHPATVSKYVEEMAKLLHNWCVPNGILKKGVYADIERTKEYYCKDAEKTLEREREALEREREEIYKQGYKQGYEDGFKDCRVNWFGEKALDPEPSGNEKTPKLEPSWNDPIEELGLTTRSFNSLRRAGVYTVGDIITKTPNGLARVRNLGEKSYMEVINILVERYGEDQKMWEAPYCKDIER